ncbi:MAG: hypothetical protein F4047_12130 [Caldilineaceae bacterium SB0670_bin_27]|uniref:Uncharacterized protein n=1 Tax=Caldilineaceae bacterium SB0664_bin_27 TaxID=2605260 RepID=A0A6B0YW62_9CHLR|nr:DUF6391 domain-containing protein [Caldilineaceae bacterium]MDE0339514.1 DUF6391 domain-containing protein [Caldilineaceae bacterium]MXY94651.1 hypothetical protein [Caldilineaceae bacterium SB0664_bin_27]MYJ78860.1 hypothetical protein [Caldilineaceae bacterium SB0670_bin_27]
MLGALAAVLQQTRQHHAIEHATIHLLAARFPRRVFAGMSDPWGFTLYGQLSGEAIEEAVGEAIQRLQDGEEELAFHPYCGTNLTTGILLVTAAVFLGSLDWRNPQIPPPEGTFPLGEEGSPAPGAESPVRRRTGSTRSLLERMTVTAGLMALAFLVSRPLGMRMQRLTTLSTIGNRVLAQVVPLKRGQAYRVIFAEP